MATLNDIDLRSAIKTSALIKEYDDTLISGACCELRMGKVYYDLTESDKPIEVNTGESILIKPGHRVVLITREELNVPNDILARVVSKGSLFSIGLSPVSTYADPGFSGKLGIVTQNTSDKYILLPPLEPIAKIEFSRLTGAAKKIYNGQHGFHTKIWPIKHQFQKSYTDVSKDRRVGTEREEAYKLLPEVTADTLKQLEKRQKFTNIALFLMIILNATTLFLNNNQLLESVNAVVINLFASLIVGVVGIILRWKQ